MGDTDAPNTEIQSECKSGTCDIPKSSIEILKKSKSSENIAISKANDEVNSSTIISAEATEKPSTVNDTSENNAKNEKVKEALNDTPKTVDELKNDKATVEIVKEEKDDALQMKEKAALKNRSDIFSLNENKNMPSTIFSVGGAPSKSIHKTSSINSNQTSVSNDTIGSASSRKSQFRNPLTGIGVSSNDEYKNKPTKRRDGNPLLGVGYKDDDEFFSPPTTQRIPPGGHSKGLW